MAKMRTVRRALQRIANSILAVDETTVPKEQLDFLYSYTSRFNFEKEVQELNELVRALKKRHMVDSICVSYGNGTCLISTNGNNLSESVTGTALFNYIASELPKSEAVTIKGQDDWYMLLPFRDKIYIIRAGAGLESLEMKAIAKDVEKFLSARGSADAE
ncbi:MAG: hypothetical protein ABH854_00325 [Candidatus Diapherotrites archaeon]|nr:hypothetical protein [Candidatus Micrarchaeota archaeon]MBU1939991.1 hypothetical protein [Candidatus Micrarchaeota archaeon]